MTDDEAQLNTARLGIEAEAFIRSPLGKYMLEKAELLIEQATMDLIECQPDDIARNTKYRNKITVGALFKQFLHEAKVNGDIATQQIQQDEDLQ